MKGVHLVEDNIYTRTWSFDSIDCMYEHVMHKFLESYRQPIHGWEIQGFPICSFEILVVTADVEDSMAFVWKKDSYTFHTLHQRNLKDFEEADHNSLHKGHKCWLRLIDRKSVV